MPDTIRAKFPNEPTFTHLLAIASKVRHTIIHDAENGVDATFQHLLADVLQTQQTLRKSLPETVFDSTTNLVQESRPCMLILSPGNYEFVVAGLAILSIGAAFAALGEHFLRNRKLHVE
jgi:acyl-coenzyme A synthetase/AMP-(fatty) acid ligase